MGSTGLRSRSLQVTPAAAGDQLYEWSVEAFTANQSRLKVGRESVTFYCFTLCMRGMDALA